MKLVELLFKGLFQQYGAYGEEAQIQMCGSHKLMNWLLKACQTLLLAQFIVTDTYCIKSQNAQRFIILL